MKIGIWKRTVLAVALPILVAPFATAQESRSAELEVGTASTGVIVAVTIDESITTSTKAKKAERAGYRVVRPGEIVWGRVIGDTPLGDQGVIEAGARVAFTVGEAKKNRRMGRKGILVLEARLIQSERLGVTPFRGGSIQKARGTRQPPQL